MNWVRYRWGGARAWFSALRDEVQARILDPVMPRNATTRWVAVPFNQAWPGYQRPIDQTELAGFAHWGMSSPVSVAITSKRSFTNVVVRSGAREVRPAVNRRVITFALRKAGQLTVELDGSHHALHLFADPPEGAPPGGDGRGIIDSSAFERGQGGGCIRLTDCSNVSVTGRPAPRSFFNGLDAQHSVQGITLDNLRLNGKLTATAAEARLSVGQHVSDVRFGEAAKQ